MRKNRLRLPALMLALALTLGGCRLAREEIAAQGADRFVGLNVVLTKDPWQDDVPRSEPHELDGAALIIPSRYDGETNESYIGAEFGDCFADVHQGVHVTDDSVSYSISAKMYVCDDQRPEGGILRLESVYQRPDGSLYAIDAGSSYSGTLAGLGYTCSERSTVTGPDDKISDVSTSVQLDIVAGDPAVSAVLIEMDSDSAEIRRETLGDARDLILSSGAAWALLEERLEDGSVRRTACNPPFEDAVVRVLRSGGDGICVMEEYYLNSAKD